MGFLDINGWELIILAVVGVVILGPERLPQYAAKLARLVRQLRAMAEGAQTQLKEQMGPEFENVNWRQYDPRQYDPRRIVREALFDEPNAASTEPDAPTGTPSAGSPAAASTGPGAAPTGPAEPTAVSADGSLTQPADGTSPPAGPANRWDEAT